MYYIIIWCWQCFFEWPKQCSSRHSPMVLSTFTPVFWAPNADVLRRWMKQRTHRTVEFRWSFGGLFGSPAVDPSTNGAGGNSCKFESYYVILHLVQGHETHIFCETLWQNNNIGTIGIQRGVDPRFFRSPFDSLCLARHHNDWMNLVNPSFFHQTGQSSSMKNPKISWFKHGLLGKPRTFGGGAKEPGISSH